jgi:hypothetical protein
MSGYNDQGHKFNTAEYGPVGLYPQYKIRSWTTHVKFQRCACGVSRVVTRGIGAVTASLYFVGQMPVVRLPACTLKDGID